MYIRLLVITIIIITNLGFAKLCLSRTSLDQAKISQNIGNLIALLEEFMNIKRN